MTKNTIKGLFFLVLVCACLSQDASVLSKEDLNNPELMKVLNNYFGCKTWTDGICTECSKNYYFNAKGICCEVKPECRNFNRQAGICEGCYQGYEIVNGACVISDIANSKDKGCREWKNGVCSLCSQRWYFGPNNVCQPVDNNCRQWSSNGECKLCYNGYLVQNNRCIRDQNPFVPAVDSLCSEWKDRTCVRCAPRAYFDDNGVCKEVNKNCNTWDAYDGLCLTCYKGYNLNNGVCVASDQTGPKDLGCKRWDWDNQKCLECSTRWVFGANGACVPVDNGCATFDGKGVCTACYKGYNLNNGVCVASDQTGPKDLGCKRWDWDNQKCLECSTRWVFGANGACVPVDNGCATFDGKGVCTACYKGYNLNNGVCVASDQTGPKDLGCKRWDWDNQKCLECSTRWVFGANGACVPVDNGCATFDGKGVCTACYKGYNLNNGVCVASDQTGPKDLGCKRWDWDNQKCLECSTRWVFGANGACVPVDNGCATFDGKGVCTACYKGYNLNNGVCVASDQTGPKDLGCKRWDWDNQKCLECSTRWVFGANGACVPVDNGCATFDGKGVCTACYKGYNLNNGVCVASDQTGPKDLGCKRWDWDNQKCLECSTRWVFGANGACVPVDNGCATFDGKGVCTACYKGYNLNNGVCVASDQTGPKDLGCKRWDWDNQKCLECSTRWVFGANGACVPVDNGCATFDGKGVCTACYKGYNLNNGVCVASDQTGPKDLGCKRWDWDNQKCLECSTRWVFGANGACVPVDNGCATFDGKGVCTACYKGYNLNNGVCVASDQTGPKDLGCKRWDWDNQKCLECSTRWVFGANGACVPVDNGCATFDGKGVCTACYKGYNLNNGVCVASDQTGPKDLGCKRWDWDNQKCLECSTRWVFGANGACVPVDNGCATFDGKGVCTACYKGYNLNNGVCVASDQTGPKDLGCKRWDWDNQKCLECSTRWVFGANGACVPVDNGCATFDGKGVCTACYSGYQLQNGQCLLLNISCKTASSTGSCLSCYSGYVLYKSQCVPLSKLASLAQYYAECCPQKLAALREQERLV